MRFQRWHRSSPVVHWVSRPTQHANDRPPIRKTYMRYPHSVRGSSPSPLHFHHFTAPIASSEMLLEGNKPEKDQKQRSAIANNSTLWTMIRGERVLCSFDSRVGCPVGRRSFSRADFSMVDDLGDGRSKMNCGRYVPNAQPLPQSSS